MKNAVKDGWHVAGNSEVYVENGMVLRAVKDGRSASVYKSSPTGGWNNACPLKYSTFVSGFSAGRYEIK